MPLIIHGTDGDFPVEDIIELKRATSLKVVLAHVLRVPATTLPKLSEEKGLCFDTSPFITRCERWKIDPYAKLQEILSIVGEDKLIFGSDLPFTKDYSKEIKFWRDLSLDETTKEKILYRNATKFLGIKEDI